MIERTHDYVRNRGSWMSSLVLKTGDYLAGAGPMLFGNRLADRGWRERGYSIQASFFLRLISHNRPKWLSRPKVAFGS